MEGMTREQVDRAELADFAVAARPMRPRDAATLILLDRRGGHYHILMGRRHSKHVFMPGKFVFPGGRTDPTDSRIPVAEPLHPAVEAKLIGTGSRATGARARAIALSAIRETYEEAGLLIGQKGPFSTKRQEWSGFASHEVQPSLGALRFIARAITPPGSVRRFDARFLAVWRQNVALELADGGPTHELEELVWLRLDEARQADIPSITKIVLEDLERRLNEDPMLGPDAPVPFYRMIRNRFVRSLI